MLNTIFNWFEFTFPGPEMRGTYWLFPTAEALHFVGICLLFGGIGVVDLRLIGLLGKLPMRSAFAFLPIAAFGFVVCVLTGWLFVSDNPGVYFDNPAFTAKMALIVIAGANAAWFALAIHSKVWSLRAGEDAPVVAKISGGASLALWLVVLVLGRLLPLFGAST